jgi:hypothetical protein
LTVTKTTLIILAIILTTLSITTLSIAIEKVTLYYIVIKKLHSDIKFLMPSVVMLNAITLNVVAPNIVRLKINEDLDFDQQFPVLIISLKTKPETYHIKLLQVKLLFQQQLSGVY